MPFVTGTPQTFDPGPYSIVVDAGTGTAALEISVAGGAFIAVTDGSYSADATDVIDLPLCQLQATITGDATIRLDKLKS